MSDFRSKLAEAAAGSGGGSASKELVLINMQNKKNQGSVVFVPFCPNDGKDDPIIVLNNVMEVGYQLVLKDKDNPNKVNKYPSWYRFLNKEDYPDLNPEEVDEYKVLRAMGSKLNAHKFSKNETQDRNERNKRIRFKNYILLVGWVIEHRDTNGKKLHENIPAVLAFSSKTFATELDKALKVRDKKTQGTEWQAKLFNANLKDRSMYLSIDYKLSEDKKKIGYIVTISVEKFDDETIRYTGGNEDKGYLLDLTKYADKIKVIENPLHKFANVVGRLYNRKMVDGLTERLHELMNKYCGGQYKLKDGKTVQPVAVKDPMEGIQDKPSDLPPTDAERSTGADAWDD